MTFWVWLGLGVIVCALVAAALCDPENSSLDYEDD